MPKRKPVPSYRDRVIAAIVKQATIELVCEPEQERIEGNCSAIDPQTDREQEQWVRDQLAQGNEWAWCTVAVHVSLGDDFTGSDYLGCCSYLSEDDFKQPGGYYADMVQRAAEELADKLIASDEVLANLGVRS